MMESNHVTAGILLGGFPVTIEKDGANRDADRRARCTLIGMIRLARDV